MNSEILCRMFSRDYKKVGRGMPMGERFDAIKHNYGIYQQEVNDGDASWLLGDPYQIADWVMLFTPIESAAWHDIRSYGVPMWPQFPVGKYFADFGNPVAKVALECDGKQFHDPKKDALRDKAFASMGWRVIRAPGWQCVKVLDDEEDEDYRDRMTLDGIMKNLRDEFRVLRRAEGR